MGGGDATMRWVWWAVGAVISFVAVAFAVFGLEMNPALLFGWAIGMIVSALMVVFKRGG
jgi:hypothetical protein